MFSYKYIFGESMTKVAEVLSEYGVRSAIMPVDEVDIEPLREGEIAALRNTLEFYREKIEDVSPKLARYWSRNYPAFEAGAAILKGMTGGEKTFSTGRIDDMAGALCGRFIIPEDFGKTDFSIDVTKGTLAYLWGSDTTFFTPSTAVNKRCVIVIMQNGIVYLDEKPIGEQYHFIGKEKTYYPYVSPITDGQSLEENKLIYASYTPGAIILPPRAGSKLAVMPEVTGAKKYYLFGMAFFERDYYTTPTAASLI